MSVISHGCLRMQPDTQTDVTVPTAASIKHLLIADGSARPKQTGGFSTNMNLLRHL